jgi:hypothetical protein
MGDLGVIRVYVRIVRKMSFITKMKLVVAAIATFKMATARVATTPQNTNKVSSLLSKIENFVH